MGPVRSQEHTWIAVLQTAHLWTTVLNAFDFSADVIIATILSLLLAKEKSEFKRLVVL
jgi:hypothetical protein